MQFISYSQNFEDLMLFRALKDVQKGFYIDLGAADPELNSVTKAFYDRGWNGINVEPGLEAFKRLKAARPRDVNLNIGAWDSTGQLKIYFVGEGNELSTTNTWLMEQHKAAGWEIREEVIPVKSLADMCREHVPAGQDIHFLKADVEGAETEVFKGHDFSRWRPWIIVVESHEPERKGTHWHPMDKILTESGYVYTYCDGLNRFYVSKEKHDQLKRAFEVPPNVYDNWVRAEELDLRRRLAAAQSQLEKFGSAPGQSFLKRLKNLFAYWIK